jgi:hypothetical protein
MTHRLLTAFKALPVKTAMLARLMKTARQFTIVWRAIIET